MFRHRRSSKPDRSDDPGAVATGPNGEESVLPSERERANWLSDLPDVRYPAMDDLLEGPAVESPPRDRAATGTSAQPMTNPDRAAIRATRATNDALVSHAVAAFEAVQEAATATVTRIKEAGRDAERNIDQLSGHRAAALERRVSALGDELSQLGDQLAGTLREAMLDFAIQLEQRVASYSGQLLSQHADEMQRQADAHVSRITESSAEQGKRLTAIGQQASERVESLGRETSRQLRSFAEGAAGVRRAFIIGLGIVAVLAIVGVVLAVRAGGI